MKQYRVDRVARFYQGARLKLTKKQAFIRSGHLKKLGEDTYLVKGHVELKAGEVIGVENPDKIVLECMTCLEPDTETKKAPAKKKATKK